MNKNRLYLLALVTLIGLSSQACQWWPEFGIPATREPFGEFNPVTGMQRGPVYRDQQPGGMLYPAVNSQPVNYKFDNLQKDQFELAKRLRNPVLVSEESVAFGKKMYGYTCIVCHGAEGKGDGRVIREDRFNAKLPDLAEAKIIELTDGQIYHVITHGYGLMYSYKSQLMPAERWAVINYIRALQRARNPEEFKKIEAKRDQLAQETPAQEAQPEVENKLAAEQAAEEKAENQPDTAQEAPKAVPAAPAKEAKAAKKQAKKK